MRIYPDWWRRNFLNVELGVAAVMTVALLAFWKYGALADALCWIVKNSRGQIYGTLASIAGSLLGFVITALSVVLGFSASDRLTVLRSSKYYKQLWDVFTSTIRVLAVTTFVWLLALFFDRESRPRPLILVFALAFSFLAILRLLRCIWVLERIVLVITVNPFHTHDSLESANGET